MDQKTQLLTPSLNRMMRQLGENVRLARLRRGFSMELVAERAGISRATLGKVEQGYPSVAFGTYLKVLHVLGLHQDVLLLAKDDELGRKLQDLRLPRRKRAPKNPKGNPS